MPKDSSKTCPTCKRPTVLDPTHPSRVLCLNPEHGTGTQPTHKRAGIFSCSNCEPKEAKPDHNHIDRFYRYQSCPACYPEATALLDCPKCPHPAAKHRANKCIFADCGCWGNKVSDHQDIGAGYCHFPDCKKHKYVPFGAPKRGDSNVNADSGGKELQPPPSQQPLTKSTDKYGRWFTHHPFKDNPALSEAIKEWIDQGRSDEEVHGVLNFFSGRGLDWVAFQPSQSTSGSDAAIKQIIPDDLFDKGFSIKEARAAIEQLISHRIKETIEDDCSSLCTYFAFGLDPKLKTSENFVTWREYRLKELSG